PSLPFLGSLLFDVNYSAPTQIYALSLHDALPISSLFCNNGFCRMLFLFPGWRGTSHSKILDSPPKSRRLMTFKVREDEHGGYIRDRKSIRLNSSHVKISYAVFCLKKKKNTKS